MTKTSNTSANLEQSIDEVSNLISTIVDLDELIKSSTEIIRQHLDCYYVGLFLTDDKQEWAELKAGTGTEGQAMLKKGIRLEIGRRSLISWVIQSRKAGFAVDTGEDAMLWPFLNPHLPETHSIIILPLLVQDQPIGGLEIHSSRKLAFSNKDIPLYQPLADKLAKAIYNARTFHKK